MYMILKKHPAFAEDIMISSFSCDIAVAYRELQKNDVRVYKLDALTEVKGVDVTYQEITGEMLDG